MTRVSVRRPTRSGRSTTEYLEDNVNEVGYVVCSKVIAFHRNRGVICFTITKNTLEWPSGSEFPLGKAASSHNVYDRAQPGLIASRDALLSVPHHSPWILLGILLRRYDLVCEARLTLTCGTGRRATPPPPSYVAPGGHSNYDTQTPQNAARVVYSLHRVHISCHRLYDHGYGRHPDPDCPSSL